MVIQLKFQRLDPTLVFVIRAKNILRMEFTWSLNSIMIITTTTIIIMTIAGIKKKCKIQKCLNKYSNTSDVNSEKSSLILGQSINQFIIAREGNKFIFLICKYTELPKFYDMTLHAFLSFTSQQFPIACITTIRMKRLEFRIQTWNTLMTLI